MEDKLNDYTEEFVNFLKNVKSVKNELDKLENEGYKFFRRLENEYKKEKRSDVGYDCIP